MKTLYYGGSILPLDRERTVEALLTCQGKIVALGSLDQLEPLAGDARKVSLEGHAMLPAFVDGHSHITAVAQTLGLAQLSGAKSLWEIGERIKAFREKWSIPDGEWVIGFGYDQNLLREGRHPTKEDLDRVLPQCPVMVTHASGHMGTVNSLGLERLGLTQATPDPAGGKLGRGPDGSLTGYLEEAAFTDMGSRIPRDPQQALKNLERAQQLYFSQGITTIHEGLTRAPEWELLESASQQGILQGDVAAYVDIQDSAQLLEQHWEYLGTYQNRLKIAGYKLFLDGSPQGRTAWMTQPYTGEAAYRGYPVHKDHEVMHFLEQALNQEIQIAVHCNGDAAAEQLLRCYETLWRRNPKNIRPIMVHAQFLRPDQVPRLKPLGMVASFFVAHVFHWGDVHIRNLGRSRAESMSPAKTALDQGIVFDFHQDSPVIPPNMLETLWCAVCRVTREGTVLGPSQRLTPFQGLQAITGNAAWALFEENQKGTLAPGKHADLVILDKDPLSCPSQELRHLQVLETIKEGKTVYQAPRS